jgi:hypothetical protein
VAIFDTECQKWPNLIRERALRSAIVAPRPPVQGLDSSSVARLARSRAPCMHLLTASCAGGWLPFSHARRTAPSATGADSRELAHGNCKRNSSSRRRRRVARTACGRRRRAQSRTPRARRRCRPTSLAVRRSPPPSAGELSAGVRWGRPGRSAARPAVWVLPPCSRGPTSCGCSTRWRQPCSGEASAPGPSRLLGSHKLDHLCGLHWMPTLQRGIHKGVT